MAYTSYSSNESRSSINTDRGDSRSPSIEYQGPKTSTPEVHKAPKRSRCGRQTLKPARFRDTTENFEAAMIDLTSMFFM